MAGLKIFVVEDDDWYNKLLVHNLSLNPDYHIQSFTDGHSLLDNLHQKPDIITLDYRLPDMDGSKVLKKILAYNPDINVIIISEQDDVEVVVKLLKLGARDYIVKSKDIRERLFSSLQLITKNIELGGELESLRREVKEKYEIEHSLIGESIAVKAILALIRKAIRTNITVSITGETGTGKELVAKAIHFNSSFSNGPFVAVNLAAIPTELIESELFGHEKGAFTGAIAKRVGKFEEAKNGTLFLDEIGEINKIIQVKLLRVLQENEIVRVGGNNTIKVNCRIVVATNKDLNEEVRKNRFREDLFYRVLGMPIHLPPLKHRENDALLLAGHFIDKFCTANKLPGKGISVGARKKILNYPWPGNIRELKSVIELAIVMSTKDILEEDDLVMSSAGLMHEVVNSEMTLREYNRRIVKILMKEYGNDTRKVAKSLDIGQTTVYRLLKESTQANKLT